MRIALAVAACFWFYLHRSLSPVRVAARTFRATPDVTSAMACFAALRQYALHGLDDLSYYSFGFLALSVEDGCLQFPDKRFPEHPWSVFDWMYVTDVRI